ncbi:hypothetical protein AHAS_Ahas09G0095100 [Arachis hypogaea]
MVFAYYVTGHEFGHATHVAEVVRHLILAGHDVHVVTAAPEFVFTNEVHSPCLFFCKTQTRAGDHPLAEIRLNRVTIHANPLAC